MIERLQTRKTVSSNSLIKSSLRPIRSRIERWRVSLTIDSGRCCLTTCGCAPYRDYTGLSVLWTSTTSSLSLSVAVYTVVTRDSVLQKNCNELATERHLCVNWTPVTIAAQRLAERVALEVISLWSVFKLLSLALRSVKVWRGLQARWRCASVRPSVCLSPIAHMWGLYNKGKSNLAKGNIARLLSISSVMSHVLSSHAPTSFGLIEPKITPLDPPTPKTLP